MDKLQLLKDISLGKSVAEYDTCLKDYFVNTYYIDELIGDRYDIIKGTKGSGKSAILIGIVAKQMEYPELQDVIICKAVNHTGDPVFKRAFTNIQMSVDEIDLIDAWKIYMINIVWKKIKDISDNYLELEDYLHKNKLIADKNTLFEKIKYSIQRVINFKKVKTTLKNTDGTSVSTEFEFDLPQCEVESDIDFNYIFETFNEILSNKGVRLWVMMDRLDDAFPNKTTIAQLALKCLLYAYKDIAGLSNFKVKIFIRNDIYNTVTSNGGFTSLTHVKSNIMKPITWSKDKLLQLFIERLLFNETFKEYIREKGYNLNNIDKKDRENLLKLLFRPQIDIGANNPDTFGWIVNHITDGNKIFTPRDFIELIDVARQNQIEEWMLDDKSNEVDYLIGASPIKKALVQVSKDKIQAQLFAEYPELRPYILKFKEGNAEHNNKTLRKILGNKWKEIVRELTNIGFLEELHTTWKIPFIYRGGLNVRQGKAFR